MSQISCSPAFTTNEQLQNSLSETVRKMSGVSFDLKRGAGAMGLSSSRLSSAKRSVQSSGNGSGDDSTTQDEAMDGDDAPN